jgi:hypothetical protein
MSTERVLLYCCLLYGVSSRALLILLPVWPFVAQGHDSYTMAQDPTGGPRAVGSWYCRALLIRSSKWCLQWLGAHLVLSFHHATPMHSMVPSCRAARHSSDAPWVVNWPVCTVVALQPSAPMSCRHLMCCLPHVLWAHDGGPDIRCLGNMCACLKNVRA